jgi:hypothetical protein
LRFFVRSPLTPSLLVLSLVALPAAAVPTTVTYAGVLTNNGAPVDGTADVVIELFDSAEGGTALFVETFNSLVVVDGDMVVDLGFSTPLDDTVLSVDALFVQVTVNGQTLAPRSRISSVPFALQAQDALTLSGLSADDINTSVANLQAQITALQGQLNALASAGGSNVAFANVTGLAFSGGLTFSGGQATIATSGVTSGHLANAAVTEAKIGTGAITEAKIASGAVRKGSFNAADQRPVYAHPSGCDLGAQLYFYDPGSCTTVSCAANPGSPVGCQSAPCFRSCLGICGDAASGSTCNAVVAGYLIEP